MADIGAKLGKRIKELRKAKGLTQENLAELIDVEPVTISRIERGVRFPQKENLELIAEKLDVKIKDLFDFSHCDDKKKLLADIQNMINMAKTKDLQYIHKMMTFYFENK